MTRRARILLFVLYVMIGCLTFGHLIYPKINLPDAEFALTCQAAFYASLFWPLYWLIYIGTLL